MSSELALSQPQPTGFRRLFTPSSSQKTARPRLQTALKWGLGILSVIVIAPLAWLFVGGLVGISVAAFLGLLAINLAPVVAMRLSNWKLRALKNEAVENPIETLQNQQVELQTALDRQADAISTFDATVETYRSRLLSEAERFPEAAQVGVPHLHQMERLLAFRRIKYKQAKTALKDRQKKVELAESRYRVALAMQEVATAAGQTELPPISKILEELSFTTVDENVNTSLAALRTAILVEEVPEADVDVPAIRSDTTLLVGPKPDLQLLLQQLQPVPEGQLR